MFFKGRFRRKVLQIVTVKDPNKGTVNQYGNTDTLVGTFSVIVVSETPEISTEAAVDIVKSEYKLYFDKSDTQVKSKMICEMESGQKLRIQKIEMIGGYRIAYCINDNDPYGF